MLTAGDTHLIRPHKVDRPMLIFTFPWRGKVDRRPSAAVLLREERRRGASAMRSAAGWGESSRSALRIPASPCTPPRVPSGRDPPPPGEGEKKLHSGDAKYCRSLWAC